MWAGCGQACRLQSEYQDRECLLISSALSTWKCFLLCSALSTKRQLCFCSKAFAAQTFGRSRSHRSNKKSDLMLKTVQHAVTPCKTCQLLVKTVAFIPSSLFHHIFMSINTSLFSVTIPADPMEPSIAASIAAPPLRRHAAALTRPAPSGAWRDRRPATRLGARCEGFGGRYDRHSFEQKITQR